MTPDGSVKPLNKETKKVILDDYVEKMAGDLIEFTLMVMMVIVLLSR